MRLVGLCHNLPMPAESSLLPAASNHIEMPRSIGSARIAILLFYQGALLVVSFSHLPIPFQALIHCAIPPTYGANDARSL